MLCDQLIYNISYQTANYPATYVLQYISVNGNYGFNVYEYPFSSVNPTYYNSSGNLLGQYFFNSDENSITIDTNNITFYITQPQDWNNAVINVNDVFYFTVLVPEPQTFGSDVTVNGILYAGSDIYPLVGNLYDIGTLGDITYDPNTNQLVGNLQNAFRNIVGNNLYSINNYTNTLFVNQIGNIQYQRLLFNNYNGLITTDNNDLYIKLQQYNEANNTGVSFKVGRQNNFSTTINIANLTTSVSISDLQNLNISTETIVNSSGTTQQRIGYFTNIPNVGDVVYLNKG
ncbi:MAG: hypothetical protein QXV17_14115 [Candidatus Micrarchaeaceae archaeon]